jgi:Uma2 family endonuclease
MTTTRFMSADDLWNLPSDDLRHELVKGELRTMAPTGFHHGSVTMRLGGRLFAYATEKAIGNVLGAETGFVLSRNPDTVRAPDIGFVRASRIPPGEETVKFWEGAPDLAVEVLSPSDTIDEVEEKVDDYLAAGTMLVWVVNSRRKTVTVYRPNQQPVLLSETDELSGEEVVPGFRIPIAAIFG